MNQYYTVAEEETGERLDKVLTKISTNNLSRGQIQKLIHEGVLINRHLIQKAGQKLSAGDIIEWKDDNFSRTELKASDITLDIIYEDEDILVINKKPGYMVHPDTYNDTDTVVQMALAHYPDLKKAVYEDNNPLSNIRPGIVHRLDRDTSGVMIIAKNREALLNLKEQFQNHSIKKEYLAYISGKLDAPVTIDARIKRKNSDINKMTTTKNPQQGKEAVSHFNPLKYIPEQNITLCSVVIDTGRTHQIRVHAKSIGHPVIGDTVYSNKESLKTSNQIGSKRQMLHAWKIECTQPSTNQRLNFQATPPADFLAVEKGQ